MEKLINMTNTEPKHYDEPRFELIRQDGMNKVFFAASGTPGVTSVGGSMGTMTSTDGAW